MKRPVYAWAVEVHRGQRGWRVEHIARCFDPTDDSLGSEEAEDHRAAWARDGYDVRIFPLVRGKPMGDAVWMPGNRRAWVVVTGNGVVLPTTIAANPENARHNYGAEPPDHYRVVPVYLTPVDVPWDEWEPPEERIAAVHEAYEIVTDLQDARIAALEAQVRQMIGEISEASLVGKERVDRIAALDTEIEELRAENEELRAERDRSVDVIGLAIANHQRLERYRKALEPFADHGLALAGCEPSDLWSEAEGPDGCVHWLAVEHFHAAARAFDINLDAPEVDDA